VSDMEENNWNSKTVHLNLIDWPEGRWTSEIEKLVRDDLSFSLDDLEEASDLIFHDFNVSTGLDSPSILIRGGDVGFDVIYMGEVAEYE